jgi:O-antigen/teichoic acid export membrane protein
MIQRITKILPATGSISGNAVQIFALQVATFGPTLITNILIARVLGPADKGILDLFYLLNSFIFELGLFGFSTGLLYYLTNKGQPLKAAHGTGLAVALVMGGLAFGLGGLGLRAWKAFFPGLQDWMILLAFGLAPFAYYRAIGTHLMLGTNRSAFNYRTGLFFSAGTFLITGLVWAVATLKIDILVVVFVLLTGGTDLLFWRAIRQQEPGLSLDLRLAANSARYGLITLPGLVANLVHFRIDQVILNHFLGTGAVGIYAVSVRWAELLLLLDSPLTAASLYRVSTASGEEGYTLTRRLSRAQLLLSGLLGSLLALAAYPLVMVLYGRDYRGAIGPLIVLIPGLIAWSASKILSQYLVYNRGLFWVPTVSAVISAVINIGLNIVLVPSIGIWGAAIASTLSYSSFALLLVLVYQLRGKNWQPIS